MYKVLLASFDFAKVNNYLNIQSIFLFLFILHRFR